jgi:hypothetical protein
MMKIIEETPEYIVYNHTGVTRYKGCQCRKSSCTCKEDFISYGYNFYSVKKKFGKYKTTRHNTLDEVKARIEVLMAVPNKRYHGITNLTAPKNTGANRASETKARQSEEG